MEKFSEEFLGYCESIEKVATWCELRASKGDVTEEFLAHRFANNVLQVLKEKRNHAATTDS
jgi:hypothetical protein